MAQITKPPKKAQKLGNPPAKNEPTVRNLQQPTSTDLEGLNFKVNPEFKKEYRLYAAERGKSMVDILKESFELYRKHNPIR